MTSVTPRVVVSVIVVAVEVGEGAVGVATQETVPDGEKSRDSGSAGIILHLHFFQMKKGASMKERRERSQIRDESTGVERVETAKHVEDLALVGERLPDISQSIDESLEFVEVVSD